MSVFVVSVLQIHKANVSADSLLSSPMPLLTPQSLVGLAEKIHRHRLILQELSGGVMKTDVICQCCLLLLTFSISE